MRKRDQLTIQNHTAHKRYCQEFDFRSLPFNLYAIRSPTPMAFIPELPMHMSLF